MKYKGYTGSVAFDAEDRIFHGRVLGVSSALIGFEGATGAGQRIAGRGILSKLCSPLKET